MDQQRANDSTLLPAPVTPTGWLADVRVRFNRGLLRQRLAPKESQVSVASIRLRSAVRTTRCLLLQRLVHEDASQRRIKLPALRFLFLLFLCPSASTANVVTVSLFTFDACCAPVGGCAADMMNICWVCLRRKAATYHLKGLHQARELERKVPCTFIRPRKAGPQCCTRAMHQAGVQYAHSRFMA